MRQSSLSARRKASQDAWFGCWLPVRASRRYRRFRWLVVAALFAVSLASAVQRWEKVYGGQNADLGYDVHQTKDGGYIVATSTCSFGLRDHAAMWLLKLDSLGDTTWTRIFRPLDRGSSAALAVCQTTDGGYAAAGVWRNGASPPGDTSCFYVVRLNGSGDSIWSRLFWVRLQCVAYDIEQTTDGGYIVVGPGAAESTDALARGYAVKCDSIGNLQWSHGYGNDSANWLYCAHQTTDGGYIMAGYAHVQPYNEEKGWMLRTDSAGNVRWMRTYGGDWDQGFGACIETREGNFIAAGGSSELSIWGDCWIVMTDSNGDTLFTRFLYAGPLSEGLTSVCRTFDEGYMFAGTTNSIGAGNNDGLLIKTDSQCNVQWLTTVGSALEDNLHCAEQTADSGYIMVGNTLYSGSTQDIHLWKTDAEGRVGIREKASDKGSSSLLKLAASQFGSASSPISIRYFLAEPGRAELAVYDITGRRRQTLAAAGQNAGWHDIVWGCEVPAGAYVLRLVEGSQSVAAGVTVLP